MTKESERIYCLDVNIYLDLPPDRKEPAGFRQGRLEDQSILTGLRRRSS